MQLGHYINPAQLAAEREAEQAMKAAEQATLEAAMDAIPDSAFDDHPEVVDLRSKLATATAELKAAKAARAKIDKNPTPARIEELRAEIARREPALRVAEAAAVAKGDTAMPEVLKVRAELRTLADELASLESGWASFLAGIELDTSDANLTEPACAIGSRSAPTKPSFASSASVSTALRPARLSDFESQRKVQPAAVRLPRQWSKSA